MPATARECKLPKSETVSVDFSLAVSEQGDGWDIWMEHYGFFVHSLVQLPYHAAASPLWATSCGIGSYVDNPTLSELRLGDCYDDIMKINCFPCSLVNLLFTKR